MGSNNSGAVRNNYIRLPIFNSLDISNYSLYPGTEEKPGLHIDFKQGLTLIVGANGLGKTTLITLLYRMLSGGYDLGRDALQATELGGSALEVTRLKPKQRQLFAERVNDRAKNATAKLCFEIGDANVEIERRLDNLGLTSLIIDGTTLQADEDAFKREVQRLANVASFGDWLLLLRQVIFYFEDRRSLIWDPSAQRQVFRILFLSPEQAGRLYKIEREYLQKDSEVRNLSAALFRLQQRIAKDDIANEGSADLRTRIESLRLALEVDQRQRDKLLVEYDDLDEHRRELRRDLLQAEEIGGRIQEQIEDVRLRIVYSNFPDAAATSRYLISTLLTAEHCSVCGSHSLELKATLAERVERSECVLCGSSNADSDPTKEGARDRILLGNLRNQLNLTKERIASLRMSLTETAAKYQNASIRLAELTMDIDARKQRIDDLIALLPAAEDEQIRAREELNILKSKIATDKRSLESLGEQLSDETKALNTQIQLVSEEIKSAFGRYAGDFLFETAILKWSPQMRRIGQLNKFETASFDLDMSGTDFTGVQRRSGPEAVSESQREFIDLAFRMALMEIAAEGTPGSLVIDAPESSLDAVFVERASEVLTRFGNPQLNNRLVIASNIIDGRLLPGLIKKGTPKDERHARIVNLLEIAVPTAAVRNEKSAYLREWGEILRASE